MNIKHLSYSSIALWQRCPREWYLKYNYKLTEPAGPALAFGTAMHKSVQNIIIGKLTADEAVSKFRKELESAAINCELVTYPKTLVTMGENILGDPVVRQIISNIHASESDQVERKVTFTVPGVSVPVIGYIDIIDDSGHPYDIKTSSWDWDENRASAEIQPDFYLTALDEMGDHRHRGEFSHLVIVKNANAPVAYLMDSTRADYKQRVFDMVTAMWEGVQREEWKSNTVREACSTCKLRADCYLMG